MTEQQANALMESIELSTTILELRKKVGLKTADHELELAALTALCRHRDRAVFGDALHSRFLSVDDLQRFKEMQTWETT